VTSSKLTNNFAGLVTSSLGPDVARGPPVTFRGTLPFILGHLSSPFCMHEPSVFVPACRLVWVRHVARMGEVRGAYNILVGGPEGRRPLGRPRRR
jgi:hypothetical protein